MSFSPLRRAPLLLIPLALAACSSVSEAVKGPQLSAIPVQAGMTPMRQEVLEARDTSARPASSNSLWRNGARAFFHDQRASKVGDILTVNIDIKDNATLSNDTATSRATSTDGGVSHLFGLETLVGKVLPGNPDPAHLVTTGSNSSLAGKGSVNRSEAVSLTIAAVVSKVLPNGNLMIEGRQEVRINQEMRELTIAGIVRPEDVTADNTIKHTQIAQARVSYGGRGTVSRVQKTPAGQALIEQFTPF
ncbi:MAG TPA: flagellar basal body L-ring protein FlgH [Caulobacteraceae bacterium]|jgi:flagellar L-ring protein precursor FlgH|nr:flagellar basal body L-ring protein FlgH [Caulobacteraceae bacterium]